MSIAQQGLDARVQTRRDVLDHRDAAPGAIVQRLDHHRAVLAHEVEQPAGIHRHPRRRREFREARRQQFLVELAQRPRRVDLQHARRQPVEHLRQVQVVAVEGRVLADQQRVDVVAAQRLDRPERERRHRQHRPRTQARHAVLQRHVVHLRPQRRVAAVEQLLHQQQRGFRRQVQRRERIHHEHKTTRPVRPAQYSHHSHRNTSCRSP
ncbi:hypothetical protein HNQ58_001485 [Rehaibacterium terrae]|uniref:Uncharacterized protein n=1 Tax=Rehaibacterium terrae TaxID=1341696 RepID=A0A7W7XZZ5_9GAMM|nr:hypothetical protein [Rehaibacterium terrae]MBB5015581.1 hypothetical protein [Rehaibacterium terrae]